MVNVRVLDFSGCYCERMADADGELARRRNRANAILRSLDLGKVRQHARPKGFQKDVWTRGSRVLHVAKSSQCRRIPIEVAVLGSLPDMLGSPHVVANGSYRAFPWMLQERLPGVPLANVWSELHPLTATRALREVIAKIDVLQHAQLPEGAIPGRTSPMYLFEKGDARTMVASLHDSGAVDPAVARKLLAMHADLRQAMKHEEQVPSHGDLHLENILWDPSASRVSALIDFEGVALAPRDLDAYKLFESVAYLASTYGHHRHAVQYLERYLQPFLQLPGGPERWKGYALARTLWYGTLVKGTKEERQKSMKALGEQLRMIAEGTAFQLSPVRMHTKSMLHDRKAVVH